MIASHLHFDHAGGFTTLVDGVVRPRFRNGAVSHSPAGVGGRDAPARPQPRQLPRRELRAARGRRRIDFIENDGDVLPAHCLAHRRPHHAPSTHQDRFSRPHGRIPRGSDADRGASRRAVDHGYDLYPMDTFFYKTRFIREAIDGEYAIFFEHDPAIAAA